MTLTNGPRCLYGKMQELKNPLVPPGGTVATMLEWIACYEIGMKGDEGPP